MSDDPSAVADRLTVLRAHEGRRLTKTFRTATNGIVAVRQYDKATWFAAESVPAATIHDLHRLLMTLEDDAHACVIRGEPLGSADPARLRRTKKGVSPFFEDVPRRWIMLDLDRVPLRGVNVLGAPTDAARALLDFIATPIPELHDVTAILQLSASAGLIELAEAEMAAGLPPRWGGVAKPGLSAHVWYWLRTPLAEADLLRWRDRIAAHGLDLDPATLRTVQPHYTATPVFTQPLRDPLAGRRTVLVPGFSDETELIVPAPELHVVGSYHGPFARTGLGFPGHLAAIGGADGFRMPIFRAVASYVATNFADPDTTELKAAIRAGIAAADPGGRTAAELRRYASDAHLDEMIAWCVQQETAKHAQHTVALGETVPPTYPDRGVSREHATAQVKAILSRTAQRIASGERVNILLKVTAGAGKTHEVIDALPLLRDAAQDAEIPGAHIILNPRHNLSGETIERIANAHPDIPRALWQGIEYVNPTDPSDRSCLDPELPRAAKAAGLASSAACIACQRKGECSYQKQKNPAAEIQIGAHQLAFRKLPKGLPDVVMLVFDEDFSVAAMVGNDDLHPVQLALSALLDDRTGGVTGIARERLLFLRRLAADLRTRQDHEGGLLREAFVVGGFTVENAREWEDLEWETKPRVKLREKLPRAEVLDVLGEAAGRGFNRLRPMLARCIRELLSSDAARSISAELVFNVELGRGRGAGDVIRFRWREDLHPWGADISKIVLDVTAEPEILRHFIPDLEVFEIEVKAPHQHVHQIVGHDFGRRFFVRSPRNVSRAVDLIVAELAATNGKMLVIAQEAVEALIKDELAHRFDLAVPERLHLAHFGNITGLDRHRDVATVIVLGRPALGRLVAEQLAEIIARASVQRVADEDPLAFSTVTAGIRRPEGTGTPIQQPTHPDPLVEAVRRSVTESNVLQAIARGRGVQRTAADPVRVVLVASLALPLTVETVTAWEDAIPDAVMTGAAEGAIIGRALPLHPEDMTAARPDLWATPAAARKALQRQKSGQSLCRSTLKGMSTFQGLVPARYRKQGSAGQTYWRPALVPLVAGREALQAVITGRITAFEVVRPPPAGPMVTSPAVTAPLRPSSPPGRSVGLAAELPPAAPLPVAAAPVPALPVTPLLPSPTALAGIPPDVMADPLLLGLPASNDDDDPDPDPSPGAGGPAPWPGEASAPPGAPGATLAATAAIALLALYPRKRVIHLFLDNARYHHARLVQAWLARPGCRIKLHFIPTYCPHLDPIERLWGLMHKHVTHNKCHDTFRDFREAILTFLREEVPGNWRSYCDHVTDNFRIISPKDFRILA